MLYFCGKLELFPFHGQHVFFWLQKAHAWLAEQQERSRLLRAHNQRLRQTNHHDPNSKIAR